MTERTEPSEAAEWLTPVGEQENAAGERENGGEPADHEDDWRRSKLEANRARRTADAWFEELSARVARLERRMETVTNGDGGLDSNRTQPRKEPS